MRTVLGLSVTTNGVGWVLVDATVPTGRPIDDDRFAVRHLDDLVPRCLAAVRGAAGIAAAAGYRVGAVGVCWSADLEDRSTDLLAALRDAGWADVRPVRQITPPVPEFDELADSEAAAQVPADLFGAAIDTVVADCAGRVSDCDPEVMQAPAYRAAHLVLTNAVPTRTAEEQPARGTRLRAQLGGRLLSLAGAAAVTAVIALFAVGSQFGGSEVPESATLANRATVSTPQTSPIVPAQPVAAPVAAPVVALPPVPPVALAPDPASSPVVDTSPSTDWVPPAVEYAVPAPAAPVALPEPVSHLGDPVVPVAAPGPEAQVPAPDASMLTVPAVPVPAGEPVPAPGALPGPAPADMAPQPVAVEPAVPLMPAPPAPAPPAPAQSVDPILGALP
ncbi:hypothetical protein [Arthrobacter sp. SLBN-53]|uniref:hypothetical protein n=1 Tax=Arthrobacter sp. SLBN-53 TaxID=2768412 RepID=UPI00114F42C1|nr:hypothetical protein [Arthrobacter sp. SLBN-53]TQK27469.1 hypothetical protein FBY28_0420 [Arthrobacter sp. SLBN-53]